LAREVAPPSVSIFGKRFFAGTRERAAELICERARDDDGGYVCLCNVHVLMEADKDPGVAEALERAWLVLPDGAPIAWLQRRVRIPSERVAGPDLFTAVLDAGRRQQLRHYFFGSSDDVLSRLEQTVRERYPDILLAGKAAPPRADVGDLGGEWINRIRSAKPDIVWCGLGAPKQELWMREYGVLLRPAIVVGVGAAFDFVSGTKGRAPRWMQSAGLEWVHRVSSEPRRLFWRYALTNSRFMLRVRRAHVTLIAPSSSGTP